MAAARQARSPGAGNAASGAAAALAPQHGPLAAAVCRVRVGRVGDPAGLSARLVAGRRDHDAAVSRVLRHVGIGAGLSLSAADPNLGRDGDLRVGPPPLNRAAAAAAAAGRGRERASPIGACRGRGGPALS
jgi:hypothetical protein